MTRSRQGIVGAATLLAAVVTLVCGVSAAGAASVKWVPTTRFGREVNVTATTAKAGFAAEDLCNVLTETCQAGTNSVAGGGFTFPASVAVDPGTGTVYVTGIDNNRVQEFTAAGVFVRAFGWDVNKTKVEKDEGTQQEKNVCAAPEECQAGAQGTGLAEQMYGPQDLAVDPSTHDIYVGELFYKRIDEYTPQGEFVLMIGGNVDKTKVDEGAPEPERDVCTAASKDTCQAGEFAPGGLDGYLNPGSGNLLAFGPEGTLYVGDAKRVQEFDGTGKHKGEISLAAFGSEEGGVRALAVDQATGEVCLSYSALVSQEYVGGDVLRCFDTSGRERSRCSTPNVIQAIVIDPFGRVELTETDSTHGVVYDFKCEELATFGSAEGLKDVEGIGLNGSAEEEAIRMYAVNEGTQEVEAYKLAPVIEVHTAPGVGGACGAGPETGGSATFECKLEATANAKGLPNTTVWFEYGNTPALGSRTPSQTFSGEGPVGATIEGLRPDENYYYRIAGEDENTGGQPVTGAIQSFRTASVPPKVVCGAPESFSVTFSSAVLSCGVNPENTSTTYRFQYGSCENLDSCAAVSETEPLASSEYGTVGVMQTASSLRAYATYRFRLVAVNEHDEETVGEEELFVTMPAPHPSVRTEGVAGVGETSATLNGVVDPDGAGATYAFQVGIYAGAGTVYSTVVQGATGAGNVPVHKSYTVGGLQPGVEYAYRLVLSGAYVGNETNTIFGEPVSFTTSAPAGVLTAPVAPVMLAVPSVVFPGPVVTPKASTKKVVKKKKHKQKRKSKQKRKPKRNRRKRP